MLLDLVNIKFALDEFSPDLILEIGGGVSSSLFARYSQCKNIPYFLVDPDKNWAENTIDILKSISGISVPRFLDLPIIQKDRNICVQLSDGNVQKIKSNPEFDYENTDLISSLKLSKKPLIYLDGSPKGAYFLGAEFILDNNLKSLLSGGLCLLDCRPFAAVLLSTYASKTHYSTMAMPSIEGEIPKLWSSWGIFEDLSFSAFEI